MKILFICDKLITFILNEIIELNKINDVLILSEHYERAYEVINKPILIKNKLDQHYYRFYTYKSRILKYIDFFIKLLHDFIIHPIYAVRSIISISKFYSHPKYGIVDYIDVRVFFGRGIDIIHSPFSTPRVIDKVYLLSKIIDVPFTLSFRAHDIYESNNFHDAQRRGYKIMDASGITTISDYNKKHILNAVNTLNNIEVVHSSINPAFFNPTSVKQSDSSIMTVCRLDEQKGIIYLIKACYILNKRNIHYTCTIIGEGPEKSKYNKLIDELQIPNINFIDFLPYNEVQEKLNHSTVFVLPCVIASDGKRDILANSLKEAMAMKVPVITSNICEIEELVDDGISGILTPPQNPEAIADAIEYMFNNPDLRNKMGEAGRKKIEQDFNMKIEAGKLDKIFNKVLDNDLTERTFKKDKTVAADTE